jgi:hypothetical protein
LFRLPQALVPFWNIDEGIFAAFANSIINGQVPYRDVVDTLPPITSYLFSIIFLVFGRNNMFAIHVGLIFLILCITVALYLIGVLIGNRKIGYLAAFLFCIFSYNFYEPDMIALETEWLLAFFCSIGAFFLLKYSIKNKSLFLFLSGLSFGLAVFSKQPALLVYAVSLLFCFIFAYANNKNIFICIRAVILNMLGFSLVFAFFLSYFYLNNALSDFWFWFWGYFNKYYIPALTTLEKLRAALKFEESYLKTNYFLLVLFFSNILITTLNTWKGFYKAKRMDRELVIDWYLIFWCISSYVGVCYSGRNFGHYYIMLLPPLCLAGGRMVFYLRDLWNSATEHYGRKYNIPQFYRLVIKMLLPLVVASSILDPLELFYNRLKGWRVLLGKLRQGPLIADEYEFRELSQYIKQNSNEHEKILVWGFAPEIYALADRMSASRYIYSNYLTGFIPWVNKDTSYAIVPGAWDIFMREMNKNKPIFIIDTSVSGYRRYGKYPPEKFKRLFAFLKENYTVDTEFRVGKTGQMFRLFKRKTN